MAVVFGISAANAKKYGAQVEAVITRVTEYEDSHTVYVAYEYPEGYSHSGQLSWYSSGMREGQRLSIYVNKDDPTHIYNAGSEGMWITITLAIIMFVIGVALLVKPVRTARLRVWLMRNGKRIRTTFVNVVRTKGILVNNVPPIAILTQYTENGRVYEFFSENMYHDPNPYIRGEIEVLVDPQDYSVYYMELHYNPPLYAAPGGAYAAPPAAPYTSPFTAPPATPNTAPGGAYAAPPVAPYTSPFTAPPATPNTAPPSETPSYWDKS
jgi:hypothetical protein